MEPTTCKSCGHDQCEIEDHEKVCTNCGDVQACDEPIFCNAPDHETEVDNRRNKNIEANERLTSRIRGETQTAEHRKNVNIEKNLDAMKIKVKLLIKDANAVRETINFVSQVMKGFKGRLLAEKKLGLAGACAYFVSTKYQLGLSLTSICKGLGLKLKLINVCLKQVREICPDFEYERPNMKDLVKKYIDELASKQCDISTLAASGDKCGDDESKNPILTPLISNEDRGVLYNRVLLLVDLFEATHPYNQPNPQSLIIAVVYHAWRSLDTFKMIKFAVNLQQNSSKKGQDKSDSGGETNTICQVKLKFISFEKFCHICNLKYSANGYRIVRELQTSLLTLGKYLGNVDKLNLPWYLNDIIDNSSDLMKEHQRSNSDQCMSSNEGQSNINSCK